MKRLEAATLAPLAAPGRRLSHPYALLAHRLLGHLRVGRLSLRLPSGAIIDAAGSTPGPEGVLEIVRWRALRRMMLEGNIGLAESHVDGDWTSPDLVALLRVAAVNAPSMGAVASGAGPFRLLNRLRRWSRANSRRGSRRNIIGHYDLGNAFFRLWLDPSMLYSSALWLEETATLEEAQHNKLKRIVELLELRAGEKVLEIGCGWGALARRLAECGAGRVTGVTLSPAQLSFARDMIAREGFDARVELRLQDYRDLRGAFDRVVSIEMIEAVGEAWWPAYFAKIAEVLKPGGRALIQAITIDEARFGNYRVQTDFIQRHIFPGGFLPSPASIAEQVFRAGLRLKEVEVFGASYAQTLAEWRHRFEARRGAVMALGFDEKFLCLWSYYLCYCEAAFREQAIDVGFYLIEKPGARS